MGDSSLEPIQLDLIHLGQTIEFGRLYDHMSSEEEEVESQGLADRVLRMFNTLNESGARYTLVGGLALLRYVHTRCPNEIEVIMGVQSLKKVPQMKLLAKQGHLIKAELEGIDLVLLMTSDPLFARVQKAHTRLQEFQGQEVVIATIQGLIMLHLYELPGFYRSASFARSSHYEHDLLSLMYYYFPDMKKIVKELSNYVNEEDLKEIQDAIVELERRLARFHARIFQLPLPKLV